MIAWTTNTSTYGPNYSSSTMPGVAIVNIMDGTSSTLAVAERAPPPNYNWGHWLHWGCSVSVPARGNDLSNSNGITQGYKYQEGWTGTNLCPVPALFGPSSMTNFCAWNAANSMHPGGGNFLFADGHVAFLTFSVGSNLLADGSKTVLEALTSRASGELLPNY